MPSNYANTARHGSPYGAGVLYNRRSDGSYARTTRDVDEVGPNYNGSAESVFCQFLALCCYADADYVASGLHAGGGQVCFGSAPQRKADALLTIPPDGKGAPRRHVYWNYHSMTFHNDNKHWNNCPRLQQQQQQDVEREGQSVQLQGDAKDEDELKRRYAEALTAVDPTRLIVEYHVMTQCQLEHGAIAEVPEANVPSYLTQAKAGSVKTLLKKAFSVDSCTGTPFNKGFASQEELVRKVLLTGGYNSQGNRVGGFVAIEGGRETREGDGVLDRRMFGFCFQKSRVGPEQLGPFAATQAQLQVTRTLGGREARAAAAWKAAVREEEGLPGDRHPPGQGGERDAVRVRAQQVVADQTRQVRTHGGNEFSGSTETMSLDLARFLLQERGLEGFIVRHYIFYDHRGYLEPFVNTLLQRRHDLRHQAEAGLERNILKLVLNGNDDVVVVVVAVSRFFSCRSVWLWSH